MYISDPSTLNLLGLLLWHYTDSKPHNVNTADKKKEEEMELSRLKLLKRLDRLEIAPDLIFLILL